MKLNYFPYQGPTFLGITKIGASFKHVHNIIFGPRGDNYIADMLVVRERLPDFAPIRCTNLGQKELSCGCISKLSETIAAIVNDYPQDIIVICPTITSTLLKEDVKTLINHLPADTQKKVFIPPVHFFKDQEDKASDKTLLFFTEHFSRPGHHSNLPSVNLIGISLFNYNYLHNLNMFKQLMKDLQIEINLILPYGTSIFDLNKTGEAWANILCDRTMALTSDFLKKNHNQPCTSVLPFGLKDTRKFIEELGKLVNKDFFFYIDKKEKEMLSKWEEISAGKLKRKSICIFGDLTTAAGLAKIFKEDINCKLNFVGTFNDYKNLFHEQVKGLCENILVTDNSKKVWEMIKKQNPDIILGTLNEKYLASELGIPFIRISLPPQHITTTVFPSETLMGYTGLDILLDKISYLIE